MKYSVPSFVIALAGLAIVNAQGSAQDAVALATAFSCPSKSNQDTTCSTTAGQCCGKLESCQTANGGNVAANTRTDVCLTPPSGATAASTGYWVKATATTSCTMTCNSYSGLSEKIYAAGSICTEDSQCSSYGEDYCCGRVDTNTNMSIPETTTSVFSSFDNVETVTRVWNCVAGR